MATYKKRGGKPKTKVDKRAKIEENSATAEVFNTLDEGANKTEAWVAKNQKAIIVVVAVVVLAILGLLGYNQYIQKPKEEKAMNQMYQAQEYWEQAIATVDKDSLFTLSLNGGGGQYGFNEIMDKYSGTNAANLAHYYAGIANLNLGEYQKAIELLDKFSSDSEVINANAQGGIADAFVMLNNNEDALAYYKKAAAAGNNEFTTPKYLLKAGIAAVNIGKHSEALTILEDLKNRFPKVPEAIQADVFIGKAQAMQE